MSLATRCFACGTVFRVVQDQLKVSEGWVRCGRCNEVFNALDSLFDLDRDTPPAWGPVPATPPPTDIAPDVDSPTSVPPTGATAAESLVGGDVGKDRIDARLSNSWRSSSTPATRVNERDRLEFPDAQFDPEFSIGMLNEPAADATTLPLTTEPQPTTLTSLIATPEFVRRAQRRDRWRSPTARLGLSLGLVALLLSLGLQTAHHFRDVIVARWPAVAPAMQTWCATVMCSIHPPQRLDDIAVQSTSLTRASGPDAFKLMVTLRNHGALAFAVPSVDLNLTDAAGLLVARRVLVPADFRVDALSILPGAELPLQLLLTAGTPRVSGYTVEIFYP